MATATIPYARYIRCERTAQDDVWLGTVRRLNKIWLADNMLAMIEAEMERRHIMPGPGGNCEGSWLKVSDGECMNYRTTNPELARELRAFTDDELVRFYCAAVTYLYDIPVRKQSTAGVVPRSVPAETSGAGSGSSESESFSWWPLKLILGIAAVAIGVPAIIALAQLGLYLIVMVIVGVGFAAILRDMT